MDILHYDILKQYNLISETKKGLSDELNEVELKGDNKLLSDLSKNDNEKNFAKSILKWINDIQELNGVECIWNYKYRQGNNIVFYVSQNTEKNATKCWDPFKKMIEDNKLQSNMSDDNKYMYISIPQQGKWVTPKDIDTSGTLPTSSSGSNRSRYASVDQSILGRGKELYTTLGLDKQFGTDVTENIDESISFGKSQKKERKGFLLPKDKNNAIISPVDGIVKPSMYDINCNPQVKIKTDSGQILKYCKVQSNLTDNDYIESGDLIGSPVDDVQVFLYDKNNRQIDISKLEIHKKKDDNEKIKISPEREYSDVVAASPFLLLKKILGPKKDKEGNITDPGLQSWSKSSKKSNVSEEINRIKKLIK